MRVEFVDTNTVIYSLSEDMQHGQLIDGRLKVINPFI
jgi:predicted nucleic acid-binding protein